MTPKGVTGFRVRLRVGSSDDDSHRDCRTCVCSSKTTCGYWRSSASVNCDPLARWYRWLEYAGMGRALGATAISSSCPTWRSAQRVLILGEGDGRFLQAVGSSQRLRRTIDVVDSSAKMLAVARSDVPERIRVCFYHADARSWQPPIESALRSDRHPLFPRLFRRTRSWKTLVSRCGESMLRRLPLDRFGVPTTGARNGRLEGAVVDWWALLAVRFGDWI